MPSNRLPLTEVAQVLGEFPGFNERKYAVLLATPPSYHFSLFGGRFGRNFSRETSRFAKLENRDVQTEFDYFSGGEVEVCCLYGVGANAIKLTQIRDEGDNSPLAVTARRVAEHNGIRWGHTANGVFFPEFYIDNVQNTEKFREQVRGVIDANLCLQTIILAEADRLYALAQ